MKTKFNETDTIHFMDNDKKLPLFSSQSANPPGRENILNLLTNFKKSQDGL